MLDEARWCEAPFLIAACMMALVQTDGALEKVSNRIHTEITLTDFGCNRPRRFRHTQLGIDMLQIPFKRFTLQFVPQIQTIVNTIKEKQNKKKEKKPSFEI